MTDLPPSSLNTHDKFLINSVDSHPLGATTICVDQIDSVQNSQRVKSSTQIRWICSATLGQVGLGLNPMRRFPIAISLPDRSGAWSGIQNACKSRLINSPAPSSANESHNPTRTIWKPPRHEVSFMVVIDGRSVPGIRNTATLTKILSVMRLNK